MKCIIFGPPGSGKGTYSMRVAPKLGIVKISTGDILRDYIDQGTELSKKIESYVKNGALVPDKIIIEIFKERIIQPDCKNGFILDGFPRTLSQTKALERITKIDVMINLILPKKILVEKLSARRICKNCSDIYNIININKTVKGVRYILPALSPKVKGKCDKCGGELIRRVDDVSEVIKERLEVYDKQSKPILQYYQDKILIINIHVTRGPEILVNKIIEELNAKFQLTNKKK